MYHIHFQNNSRARDLVYEMSALYLVSRCIHLAGKLELFTKIPTQGISIIALCHQCPSYKKNALRDLFDILFTYGLVKIENDLIYNTVLTVN